MMGQAQELLCKPLCVLIVPKLGLVLGWRTSKILRAQRPGCLQHRGNLCP